jgi:hypothetical protein
VRRTVVWSHSQWVALDTLSQKWPMQKRADGVAHVVECLSGKHEPWVQTPVLPKTLSVPIQALSFYSSKHLLNK